MQTKHLCVLIHIWTKGEVGAPLNRFKPSSKICFTDRSKAALLLWIIYVISVLFCYAFMHVCLLMPCGHLLVKGWPLGSHLWCLIVTLSLSHWYLGSGVVLDCIDSWSVPSLLLWWNTSNGYQVIERTRNSTAYDQTRITPKISKAELWFLCMTYCLIALKKWMKFQPKTFNTVQLTERTKNWIKLCYKGNNLKN